MKTNFLGSSGQNTFTVTEAIKPGTSLEAQDALATDVEGALLDTEGVEIVQVSIGSSGNALRDAFVGGGDTAITYSVTTVEGGDQIKIQEDARIAVEKVADPDTITIGAQSGFGASSDIAIEITAPNQEALDAAAAEVDKSMRALPEVKQVTSNLTQARPYIAVTVNRDDAAAAGFSEVALAGFVAQSMRPTTVGTVVIEGTTLDIYIASEDPPLTVAELEALQVPTAAGPVALDTLADVSVKDGPATVTTVKGQRSATVTVTPNSEDLGTATAAIQKELNTITLPAGASAQIGGVSADQAAAFSSLGIALLVAILVVYIIMVATFGSLLQPLLLLVSVPFAATGAIGLQVITGVPLGVPSFIGLLMLVGIVVTNAIVLVDLVNQYRKRGYAVKEALIEGASRRLRPILMTALATIFALIPMAVGITGSGGFISQPLAIVVIGGLISSTALTLVVLPVLYNLVEGGREKRKAKRSEKKAAKMAAQTEAAAATAPVSQEPVFETLVVEDDGDDDSPIRRRTPNA
jgi:HAE1 family hydrophobic/amphiphilic exporter-1